VAYARASAQQRGQYTVVGSGKAPGATAVHEPKRHNKSNKRKQPQAEARVANAAPEQRPEHPNEQSAETSEVATEAGTAAGDGGRWVRLPGS
jgi:hypothetical protein